MADWIALKRLVRYFIKYRNLGVLLRRPMPLRKGLVYIDVYSDSDWAGDLTSRNSRTSGHVECDGCPMFSVSTRQDPIALSSTEAEWYAGARVLSEALGLRAVFEFMGYEVKMRWHCDNSAARQIARREGCGRIKHLAVKTLWIQSLVKLGEVLPVVVTSADNRADLGTKSHPQHTLERLRLLCSIIPMPGT